MNPTQIQVQVCIDVFLRSESNADLTTVLIGEIEDSCESEALLTLFLCLPFRAATWRLLEGRPNSFQRAYGNRWSHGSSIISKKRRSTKLSTDSLRWIGHLPLSAGCVAWDKVETSRLIRLLNACLWPIPKLLENQMTGYYIETAFDSLNKRPGVTVERKPCLSSLSSGTRRK